MLARFADLGHTPVPFSVRYADSWDSPYSGYFLPPPGKSGEPHYKDIKIDAWNWIRYLDRAIYSFEARKALNKLIGDNGTFDIAYVLNIYNYMSPSIFHALKQHNIPIILRLGDYNLLCPAYLFLRRGKPCTLCIKSNYIHGIRHRCVKNSFTVSFLRSFSMFIHKMIGIYKLVDAFVVPCLFMKSMLIQGGFPENKIHLARTPVYSTSNQLPNVDKSELDNKGAYILYFGRISYEKGLDTLIHAFQKTDPPLDLYLIGRSYDGEEERLRRLMLPKFENRVHFPGFQKGEALSRWIAGALFSVVPSRWYDNAPLAVYESFLHGTPVLAAGIGGIPEQVEDGVTGRLFMPDSVNSLSEGLLWMLQDRERLGKMGERGRRFIAQHHGMEAHMSQLLSLFERVAAHAPR